MIYMRRALAITATFVYTAMMVLMGTMYVAFQIYSALNDDADIIRPIVTMSAAIIAVITGSKLVETNTWYAVLAFGLAAAIMLFLDNDSPAFYLSIVLLVASFIVGTVGSARME